MFGYYLLEAYSSLMRDTKAVDPDGKEMWGNRFFKITDGKIKYSIKFISINH